MSSSGVKFHHIHLISEDPNAAARFYEEVLGGAITGRMELMGAPQVTVELGGMRLLIRGRRPGESPATYTKPMRQFAGYVSHDGWGADHFGYDYHGDLPAFCEEIRAKGATFAAEPFEFSPGHVICFLQAPDNVTIELSQAH
jgi:catechol 2,3-dioxygenase-like lactoylglutathione lyase family enzyme